MSSALTIIKSNLASPSPSPSPPPSTSDFLFDGTDVVLVSYDGIEFRLHSVILRAASQYFRRYLQASSFDYAQDEIRLHMTETASVLGIIIPMLYPLEDPYPEISLSNAMPVLAAIERLQIKAHGPKIHLESFICALPHPLHMWALAVRYNYPKAKAKAVEAFLFADDTFLSDIPEELGMEHGAALMKLMALKVATIQAARAIWTKAVVWDCLDGELGCPVGLEYSTHLSSIKSRNPFDPDMRTVMLFTCLRRKGSAKGAHPCCGDTSNNNGAVGVLVSDLNQGLDKILEAAVSCEARGETFEVKSSPNSS